MALKKPLIIRNGRNEELPLSDTLDINYNKLVYNLSVTSYEEVTKTDGFISNITVWQTSSKLLKVREQIFTRTNNLVVIIVLNQYATDGLTILETLTSTITRVLGRVTNIVNVLTN